MPGGDGAQRMRVVALAIVVLALLLTGYTLWVVGRPVFWRLAAEYSHRPVRLQAAGAAQQGGAAAAAQGAAQAVAAAAAAAAKHKAGSAR